MYKLVNMRNADRLLVQKNDGNKTILFPEIVISGTGGLVGA
jgi:hypothetical protein